MGMESIDMMVQANRNDNDAFNQQQTEFTAKPTKMVL